MQIKTDKEGAEAIKGLCHCALKLAGLDNLPVVTQVLAHLDHPGRTMPIPTKPAPIPEVPAPNKPETIPAPKKKIPKRGKIKRK